MTTFSNCYILKYIDCFNFISKCDGYITHMNIDLKDIILKLRWVNFKADTTDRQVSLYEISQMEYDRRKNLHFINDFHPKIINTLVRKDLGVEYNSFTKECENKGYIHFSNTSNVGIFYEATFETDNETLFDSIRITYFKELNKHK